MNNRHLVLRLSFAFTVSLIMGNMSVAGTQHDPLNQSEIDSALHRVTINSGRTFRIPQREETLLIERHQAAKGSSERLADVYIYNYDRNELKQSLVDLGTDDVISTTVSRGVQLPLTQTEIDRAVALLFADDEEHAIIKEEYRRITGSSLISSDQLNIKVFAFHADSRPENLNPASQRCGIHRCGQLLLYTHDRVVFEVSPIVDLSEEIVTQSIGF